MEQIPFKLEAGFEPAGDQPAAIAKLVEGLKDGLSAQTLLGVTGRLVVGLEFEWDLFHAAVFQCLPFQCVSDARFGAAAAGAATGCL